MTPEKGYPEQQGMGETDELEAEVVAEVNDLAEMYADLDVNMRIKLYEQMKAAIENHVGDFFKDVADAEERKIKLKAIEKLIDNDSKWREQHWRNAPKQ